MSIADPNKTILTGENPFIRLSPKDGEPNSTEASYWRIIFSPAGPGHVLYLKSELTERRWRICIRSASTLPPHGRRRR